jgi:hypothetical protein
VTLLVVAIIMGSAFVPLAIEKGWSWQTATRTAAFLIVIISFLVVGHDASGVEGSGAHSSDLLLTRTALLTWSPSALTEFESIMASSNSVNCDGMNLLASMRAVGFFC